MIFTCIVPLILTILIGLIGDTIFLPSISIFNPWLYVFLLLLCGIYALLHFLFLYIREQEGDAPTRAHFISLGGAALAVVILAAGWVFSLPLFQAVAYSSRLGEVSELSMTNLGITLDMTSLMDSESASLLAMQKLSSDQELSSQYTLQNPTQILYHGAPVFIFSLDHANGLKALSNQSSVSAFITVDMQTGEASIHHTNEPMRYTPGAIWGKDLKRHLHYTHPMSIISGSPHLEIDESGTPFYIAAVKKPSALLFGAPDISGIIVVDPCTGETEFYPAAEAPDWVDCVYPPEMLIAQAGDFGKLRHGFLNSVFKRDDILTITPGYGLMNDGESTYAYTCVSDGSTGSPSSGLLLIDMRTKSAQYLLLDGADESAAMAAAVQAGDSSDCTAGFPLPLMVEGTPTYCMTLKAGDGSIRAYAMVNVNKPHLVATGQTQEECQESYKNLVLSNDVSIPSGPNPGPDTSIASKGEISGIVLDIRTGEKDGTTHFYLRLENSETWYVLSLKENEEAIKLNISDTVVLGIDSNAGSADFVPAKLRSFMEGEPWWDA